MTMKEFQLNESKDLAYWTGVVQSDGYFWEYNYREKNFIELRFSISKRSLPMLKKFKEISKKCLNRNSRIYESSRPNERLFHIGIKSLLPEFKKLNIILSSNEFIAPKWAINKQQYFGAYLAGLIDGDGSIVVKRPDYPQCAITIYSGLWQNQLEKTIRKILNCSTYQVKTHKKFYSKSLKRHIEGTSYSLVFYVSSKTVRFISQFVLPYIQLNHKRKILQNFINSRYPN